jgi:hypothetical protein
MYSPLKKIEIMACYSQGFNRKRHHQYVLNKTVLISTTPNPATNIGSFFEGTNRMADFLQKITADRPENCLGAAYGYNSFLSIS